MHVDFDQEQVEWSALTSPFHYDDDGIHQLQQFGGYNIFHGMPYQRGAGLGSIFRSFLRYLLPIGKNIGAAIGQEGLRTGNRVLSNVLDGKDLKETLVEESKSGLKNLLEKAANNLEKQKGRGFDFKRYSKVSKGIAEEPPASLGKIRSKRGRKKSINKLSSYLGPPNLLPNISNRKKLSKKKGKKQKRLRIDAFGTY